MTLWQTRTSRELAIKVVVSRKNSQLAPSHFTKTGDVYKNRVPGSVGQAKAHSDEQFSWGCWEIMYSRDELFRAFSEEHFFRNKNTCNKIVSNGILQQVLESDTNVRDNGN